jgi:hypothetical protein
LVPVVLYTPAIVVRCAVADRSQSRLRQCFLAAASGAVYYRTADTWSDALIRQGP